MQARDNQLSRDEEQDCRSDAEELLQVDAYRALNEHHAESDGSKHSEQRSEEAHQFGRVKRNGREDEDGLRTLAQHHQKNEQKESEPGVLARQQTDFAFDFALQLASRPHHENDHGDDEEGGDQHDPAFKDIFIQVGAGDDYGDGNAAHERSDERGIDGLAQFVAADLGQIGEGDAVDEGGLDPFAQRDDESLKHLPGTRHN